MGVFGGLPLPEEWMETGIPEVIVRSVPLKPNFLANIKSNNYLLNALTAMAAREQGGKFGILLTEAGQVAESCVLNVVIVDAEGRFRTPHFDHILKGTTVRRAMQVAETLLSKGELQMVKQDALREEDLFQAQELFLCAGDTHVFPIVSLDGKPIGPGVPGPVCRAVQAAIAQEIAEGTSDNFTPVPYV